MRDKEFDIDSIRGLYKIAVIGDSHAYATSVKNMAETFPSQLEKYLNQNIGQPIVKVLNFGVPGYNTAQELEVFKTKALIFEPRMVILQYCINDTHICNYIQPEHKKLNSLIHKSQFLVLLWKNILYSSLGKVLLLDWIGTKFPDALLFQEGLVGTLNGADTEVPVRRHHPARTRDRVPEHYHYMLGEENWKVLPVWANNRAFYCWQRDLLKRRRKWLFSEPALMFIPSMKFLKKKIYESMVMILTIQQAILTLKGVI